MLDAVKVRKDMDGVMGIFGNDIGTIRTGRATPGLIENVEVSVSTYGGQKMALKQLGSIGVEDARSLSFTPWDKGIIKEIKNGIERANLGMNAAIMGELIRMILPAMSMEQRQDYVKLLGRKLEAARGLVREVRAEERKRLQEAKQAGEISEDVYRNDEQELQKLTDEYTGKLEEMAAEKEGQLLNY